MRLRLAFCLLGLMAAIPGYAAVVTSTGSGNWSNPVIWGGSVPTAADDVIIAHNVTINHSTPQFNDVTVNSGVKLTFNFTGTIFITGDIANNGAIDMVNGLLTGNGTNRTITNGSGGTITLDNSSFDAAGSIDLLNQGLFVKRGLNNGFIDFHGTFTNEASATVQVNATKAMSFAGDFINNGTVNLITNSSLRFLGANVTVNAGSSITQLSPANGNLIFGGTVNVTGNTDFVVDIPNVSHGGATLVGNGIGMVVESGVTYNMDNGWIDGFTILTNNGTMNVFGAVVKRITMDVINDNIFNFTNGGLSTNGPASTFTNTANGNLNLNGGNIDFINFVNQGVTTLTQNQAISTTFDNEAGATLTLGGNQGTSFSGNLINDGVAISNGLMSIASSGVLSGTGSVTGTGNTVTIDAGGTMSPGQSPGCMSFANNYTQLGTLEIEVNGTTACTDFDQIIVAGTASLSGTLDANISGTYATGTILTIIDAGAVSGTFSTVTPALPADWAVMYDYPNAGEVSLEFIGGPAPALDFNVDTKTAGPNNTVIVPVWVNNFEDIVNYQGTIVFDPAVLTFVEATSPQTGGPVIINNFGNPGQGTIPTNSITFLWADLLSNQQTLPDGTFVINLEFTVNANATTGFTPITLDGSVTPLGYSDDPNGINLLAPTVMNGGVNIDADPPVTTTVNIVSNNANDVTLATVGDVITLTFTTDEAPAITPVVTIAKGGSGAITVTGSGTTWTATKTVAAGDDGLVTFDIELEDQYGNTSNTTATTDLSSVTVDTEAPVITCPANVPQNTDAGFCSADVTFADATATDNLAGVSVAQTGGPVSGSTFAVGTTAITYEATDAAGNTSTCSFDVIVTDNEAPTVVTQPVTVQLDASGNGSVTVADVNNGSSDACGIASYSLDVTDFTCSDVGANTVTLTVTDVNGNSATGTAVVTVEDNVAPVVATQPVTIQLDAAGSASVAAAQVDNGSSDACGIASLTLDITSFDCSNIGANTVTLTVTDNNGNVSTGTAVVTVEDNVAPIITCPSPISVNTDLGLCGAVVTYVDPTATDNCSVSSVTISGSQTFSYLGTYETFVVPAGVTEITIDALGASGGRTVTVNGHTAGNGAAASGDLSVTPGETLYIYVGSQGGDSNSGGIGGTGGFNGGANGGNAVWTSGAGGGGGGATDVRQGGQALSNRVIVAGGGGGAADRGNGGNGAAPSGLVGTDWIGGAPGELSGPAGIHGNGGSQVAGGGLGIGYGSGSSSGFDGQLGVGGEGGPGFTAGAGGGGGYYGGGGGGARVGGNIVTGGGGGGSSYLGSLSNPSSSTGVNTGNGSVTISWNVVASTLTVSQTAGLPSGSTFPVGTTTNTFEAVDGEGNVSTCSFDVTVTDNEVPTVVTQDISVDLDGNGTATITPAQIDNGSSDACGIASYALDITSFDCNNVGANTVTLTVTDNNNNVNSATAVVTVNLVPAAAITGQAATEDNKIVAGVTFDVNGTDGPLTQLGTPAYSFLLTPCSSVNDIGGFKNNDASPINGVDVQDITKMTRHILNIEALGSPYKLLAADVNHNSLINGPDVTQVRQLVLGVRTGFPTPGATTTNPVTDDYLWTFIPQAHTWVDNTIPWTYPTRIDFLDPVNTSGNDFVGVKLGDVNNTWDETNPLTTWFADSIHMVMQDQAVTPGQLVTIPVMVRDFNAITGYQFTMNWDPGVLSLEAAENTELFGFFNTELAKKGILSTVWNDLSGQPITMEDDAVAFTLTFRVVGDWGAASAITVTSDLTNAIGYNVEEMPLAVIASTVNITVGDVSTSIDPSELEGYAFLQNVPNPFNESTTFTFALPKQEDVKIEIYNGLGQIVRTFEGTYGVGMHELQWDGANSASREVAVGVYSVRIQAGIFQSAINVKKMQ